MSLAKEKDLFKNELIFFYLPARPALPHLPSNVPRRPGHFLQALTLLCRESCLFRVRPRIMIGLETVLRVFEIS